jgi:hypothetical protein
MQAFGQADYPGGQNMKFDVALAGLKGMIVAVGAAKGTAAQEYDQCRLSQPVHRGKRDYAP